MSSWIAHPWCQCQVRHGLVDDLVHLGANGSGYGGLHAGTAAGPFLVQAHRQASPPWARFPAVGTRTGRRRSCGQSGSCGTRDGDVCLAGTGVRGARLHSENGVRVGARLQQPRGSCRGST